MIRKNKIITLLLFILIIVTIHYNYKRYKSFRLQAVINYDIAQDDFSKRDLYFIYQIDDHYPSLNIFSMPLKALKAKYLLAKDSTDQAIGYLKESIKDNPYLMFSELLLAQTYANIGDFDNYKDYTYKAIKNLPNNPLHFANYARLMKFENKTDSIFYYFNRIPEAVKTRDEQVWKILMSSIVLDSTLIEQYNGKEYAKEAASIFPTYPDIILLSDYVLFSKENVDLAIKKHNMAIELYDSGETIEALVLFEDAIKLHPNKLQYFNNYIEANHRSENFKKITDVFSIMSDTFEDIPVETLYYLGEAHYQETQFTIGCNILNGLNSQRVYSFDTRLFPKCF